MLLSGLSFSPYYFCLLKFNFAFLIYVSILNCILPFYFGFAFPFLLFKLKLFVFLFLPFEIDFYLSSFAFLKWEICLQTAIAFAILLIHALRDAAESSHPYDFLDFPFGNFPPLLVENHPYW